MAALPEGFYSGVLVIWGSMIGTARYHGCVSSRIWLIGQQITPRRLPPRPNSQNILSGSATLRRTHRRYSFLGYTTRHNMFFNKKRTFRPSKKGKHAAAHGAAASRFAALHKATLGSGTSLPMTVS